MEYTILWDQDIDGLVDKVDRLLAEGWRPQGGAFVVPATVECMHWFAQAMTRDAPAPPAPAAGREEVAIVVTDLHPVSDGYRAAYEGMPGRTGRTPAEAVGLLVLACGRDLGIRIEVLSPPPK